MSTVTSADGTTIDHGRYGEGPAVIFVGGATQYRGTDTTTSATAKALADNGFTTVNYDRRGRGHSGDTAPWSLDREVEDLAALIAAVGGSACVYTSSSGATVGLAAAVAGVGVDRLALYEPPFFAGSGHAEHLVALRAFIDAGKPADALRYNLTEVIGQPAEAVDGMAAQPWWPAFVSVAPTLLYDLTAVDAVDTDPDWAARWSGISVPVLVCSGSETFEGLTDAADAVAAALPAARRTVLPGQGHNPSTEAIVPILTEFARG